WSRDGKPGRADGGPAVPAQRASSRRGADARDRGGHGKAPRSQRQRHAHSCHHRHARRSGRIAVAVSGGLAGATGAGRLSRGADRRHGPDADRLPRHSIILPHRRTMATHPWHDTYVDDTVIERAFPVVIEIPKGSKNKYELDKETGLLRLDRVLHSAVYYPADYGFIPRTYCDDGDPLDALVLGQEPVYPLTIVEARAIGVMRMRDEKGIDDKIVAVSTRDPAYADYSHKDQL